jgi:glycosyltransferase involved in cell wall biosynthesis
VTDTPAVSVIVPCYNLGAYVTEAVDSVLAQTYPDFEIVVVNDGSTDPATNAVLAALDRPRTTVLTTENRGLPAARNHAIRHARGRYVCALDADDRLHPQFLDKTIGVLERDPSVAFVSTWVECFGVERWIWRQERCDFPALLAECVVLTASPVRREALEAMGGYDCQRYLHGDEDWDLWISLVERGFRGTIVPEVLFHYRQREGSMRRVAMQPEVRQRVWRNLLDKHRASYERFLPDVLLLMEDECGRLLLENWRLEREIEADVATLAARRAERDRLRAAVPAAATAADAALRRDLAYARAEVAALRASWSWSLTAPLRRGYDAWRALGRGLGSMTRGRS